MFFKVVFVVLIHISMKIGNKHVKRQKFEVLRLSSLLGVTWFGLEKKVLEGGVFVLYKRKTNKQKKKKKKKKTRQKNKQINKNTHTKQQQQQQQTQI